MTMRMKSLSGATMISDFLLRMRRKVKSFVGSLERERFNEKCSLHILESRLRECARRLINPVAMHFPPPLCENDLACRYYSDPVHQARRRHTCRCVGPCVEMNSSLEHCRLFIHPPHSEDVEVTISFDL